MGVREGCLTYEEGTAAQFGLAGIEFDGSMCRTRLEISHFCSYSNIVSWDCMVPNLRSAIFVATAILSRGTAWSPT